MFSFLKTLDTKVWIYIGIAIAVAVYTGVVYHAGGIGPRAELSRLKDDIASARKLHDAEDAKKASESSSLVNRLEGERDANAKDAAAAWDAYRGLRNTGSRPAKGQEPVRPVTKVCDSADANYRLSDAIQSYRSEVRAELDNLWIAASGYRQEVGRLLEIAQSQAADLITCKAYAIGEREINR